MQLEVNIMVSVDNYKITPIKYITDRINIICREDLWYKLKYYDFVM